MAWIEKLNTTNFRIVVSIGLSVMFVTTCMVCAIVGRPLQGEIINTVAMFLLGMMGIDAASFIGKRFSDIGYAAAKAQAPSSPTVAVTAPSTVTVLPDKGDKS